MILKIGNNQQPPQEDFFKHLRRRLTLSQSGLTFIEVMVALAIFSLAIVMIYQIFFSSLDRMSHLTTRLYANAMIDHRLAVIERSLRAYQTLPIEFNQHHATDMGLKTIDFDPRMKISEVEEFVDIFKIDLELTWQESNRDIKISRSAYICDFSHDMP